MFVHESFDVALSVCLFVSVSVFLTHGHMRPFGRTKSKNNNQMDIERVCRVCEGGGKT